jgi:hypothetical protein
VPRTPTQDDGVSFNATYKTQNKTNPLGTQSPAQHKTMPPGTTNPPQHKTMPPGTTNPPQHKTMPPGTTNPPQHKTNPPGVTSPTQHKTLPPGVSRTSTGSTAPPMSSPRTQTGNAIPNPYATGGSSSTRIPVATDGSGGVPRAVGSSPSGGATSRSPSGGVSSPSASGSFRAHSGSTMPPSQSARPPTRPPPGSENVARARSTTRQPPLSTSSPPTATRIPRARRDSHAATEIEQLLASKIPLLDQDVDHFKLLGLTMDASPADIRNAYFTLARKLHPDRLSAIGLDDDGRTAQRLMAQVNLAFSTLNDPKKREEYVSIQRRGGEGAVKAQQAQADEMAMKIMRAEEAFKQGEMALRREQLQQAIDHFKMACELQPKEAEYQALLAWTVFAASPDKAAVAIPTRKALIRAAEANEQSPTASFYLGRVERMLGREKEALMHFQNVLSIKPNHTEAQSEVRILYQRLNKR